MDEQCVELVGIVGLLVFEGLTNGLRLWGISIMSDRLTVKFLGL